MADDALNDSWMEAYARVPDRLRAPLRLNAATTRRYDLLHALAEELQLPTRTAGLAEWRLLHELLSPLEDVVRAGNVVLDARARQAALDALEQLDLVQLVQAATELGWADTKLPATAVDRVEGEIRDAIAARLAPKIQRMLRRWKDRGVLN